MRIMYLDTSSSFLYCGLCDDSKLIFEIKKNYFKDLSKYASYEINKSFENKKISPKTVDKIIVVNGPGSFTGVRIGVTIAKTMGWALNIPVIPVSSLQCMAISMSSKSDLVIPIIDARRSYVYAGVYEDCSRIIDDEYIKLSHLNDYLKKQSKTYTFVSSDTFEFKTLKYNPDILKIIDYFKNDEGLDASSVNPNYIKLTEAEEKLNDFINS